MSAETARFIHGAATVLAEDPCRAVAEHLPDGAVALFDRDLRVRLATGTTLPDPAWWLHRHVGATVVDLVPATRERVQAIGGQFTLRSAPGAGTRIQAQAAVRTPS